MRRLDGYALLHLAGLEMRLVDLVAGLTLLGVAVLAVTGSLTVGTTPVHLSDLFGGALDEVQRYAVLGLRLPRALTGLLAGAAIAVSGAILQSLTRNPIADPGLLGLSQGALLAILFSLVLAPGIPRAWVPLIGSAGGLAVALFLARLTARGGGDALAILLLGLAVETTLSSITSIIILYAPTDLSFAISVWLAGSLYQVGWSSLFQMLPWLMLSLPLLFVAGPMLRLLELGEERAFSLGLHLGRARLAVLVATVLLTSAAVTVTGPLAFLGIIAPHIATFLLPSSGRARLILTGLIGGIFVVAADCLSRALGTEIGLPIGLSLTLLGVPLFIIILRLWSLNRPH
ncbi:FecCD family ABC transporter permease [Allosediminivita pacifica]|uniref:Iron complex transport system permease protein n=1 Tax=Allosediminivita pacifica TaxID=1267769 RepID=A0A2T6A6F9_9RHOB|nr:iron ABC transporter permease [Allosediminivita pacifica]PTX39420.1 iron complex transport system permease protein [Allosediminivita pacifica]GGB27805.1 iron-dicitrate ABC transporter permease [Allosediminivita pacifica]